MARHLSHDDELREQASSFLDSLFGSGLQGELNHDKRKPTQIMHSFLDSLGEPIQEEDPMELDPNRQKVEENPLEKLVRRFAGLQNRQSIHRAPSTTQNFLDEFLRFTEEQETSSMPVRAMRSSVRTWDGIQKGTINKNAEKTLWPFLENLEMQKVAHAAMQRIPNPTAPWDLRPYCDSLLARWIGSDCIICNGILERVPFLARCAYTGQRLRTCGNSKCACSLTENARWSLRHLPASFAPEMDHVVHFALDHLLPPRKAWTPRPPPLSREEAALACFAILPLSLCTNAPRQAIHPQAKNDVAPIYRLVSAPLARLSIFDWECIYATYEQFKENRYMPLTHNMQHVFGIDSIDVHLLWERTMGQYLAPSPLARWNTSTKMDLQNPASCFVPFAVLQILGPAPVPGDG